MPNSTSCQPLLITNSYLVLTLVGFGSV